jgi:S-adenosylmethionine synthetase
MTLNILIDDINSIGVGIAERKGIGHPDTICDEIAERVSVELCNYYLEKFGVILHHNVDKALLIGGRSIPAFKGGEIVKPITLILAGRATSKVKKQSIPVNEIAIATANEWFRNNMRYIDVSKHLVVKSEIGSGSADLTELFNRFGKGEIPLANDTSYGAGFYPNTKVEDTILRIDKLLNNKLSKQLFPFIGEDIKVMGTQYNHVEAYTLAIAMVDKFITDIDDYVSKLNQVKEYLISEINLLEAVVNINTADDYSKQSVYLTTTGTSAENGDDGQVGRGNRINGLITPYQPMSLEATSGKNPVSHIGKIYNYFAMDLSQAVVTNGYADYASVYIVAQIGKPIDQPQLLHLKLRNIKSDKKKIEELASDWLSQLSDYWKRIISNKPFINFEFL